MADDKTKSRKWRLVLMVLVISTLGAFIPPILSAWVFRDENVLVILSGTQLVSLISIIVSAYFGFNVWQKSIFKEEGNDKKNPPTKITTNEIKVEGNENGEA